MNGTDPSDCDDVVFWFSLSAVVLYQYRNMASLSMNSVFELSFYHRPRRKQRASFDMYEEHRMRDIMSVRVLFPYVGVHMSYLLYFLILTSCKI